MTRLALLACSLLAAAAGAAGDGKPVPVTVDNFIRAETDLAFAKVVQGGGFGKFNHGRELSPLDEQLVARQNRDTLYSTAVFDMDAGDVTITLPDAGERFLSLITIDEDHYVLEVVYDAGPHTYTREKAGTRYLFAAVRALIDPADPEAVQEAHALQDAIAVDQPGGAGRFEVPNWEPSSQAKVRDALLVLNQTLPDLRRAGGRRGEVDPVRHLIATASAWGLNPDQDAIYLNVTPTQNDGQTVHELTVKDVPVDAFWSISVYNAKGYFEPNEEAAYSLNSITTRKGGGGWVTVQFGDCGGNTPNCLPITPGWNYIVRLYRPRAEILNGTWTFPQAQPSPRAGHRPDRSPG
jgi:hypothetical protein